MVEGGTCYELACACLLNLLLDMSFHFVCCEYVLLPLGSKEVVLVYGRAGRKTKLNARRKEAESGRCHVAVKGEKYQNLTSKSQINRNGLI